MAHEVQVGGSRMKVRSLVSVFLLGWLTGGIGCLAYWSNMLGEIARFEQGERGETGVRPRAETIVAVVGAVLTVWLNYFPPGVETDPITGLPVESSSGGGAVIGFALFGLYILWLYMAFRMRSHITRVMTHAGMLPEDRPSGFGYCLGCLFGPVIGTTVAAHGLNKAWQQFPRYYASIGGTKEEVAARAVAAPVDGPVTAAAPAAPAAAVAAVAIPATLAAQGAAPVAAAQPATPAVAASPQERMQQLAAGAAAGTLTSDESLEYAESVEQVHGGEHAAPWYRYVATHDPSCRKAAWWFGVYLLDRGDAGGIDLLHRVMGDPAYDQWARDKVATFLDAQGRSDEAARYRPAA